MAESDNDGIPGSNGQGWDWFAEQAEKTMKEAQERADMERREIALAFYRFSQTPDGAIVLATLESWVDVLGFDPALGFYNGAALGFSIDGQRKFLKFINQTIAKGANPNG